MNTEITTSEGDAKSWEWFDSLAYCKLAALRGFLRASVLVCKPSSYTDKRLDVKLSSWSQFEQARLTHPLFNLHMMWL